MQVIQLCLIDADSNTRSLLVLLSPWKRALEHVVTALEGASVGTISTHTRASHVLTAVTIQGWHLFRSELFFIAVTSHVHVCQQCIVRGWG